MKNVLRALVFDDQVSLTLIDGTDIVREAKKLHSLSRSACLTLGKVLCAVAYMSSALKEESGQVSVTLKGNGSGGSIGVSGDHSLHIRGYIENTQTDELESEMSALGSEGSLTVVRDDGYSRPFVGTCELDESGVDGTFEGYYRISEQLPTYLASDVRFDESGEVAFAGIAVLQPLPFADCVTLEKLRKKSGLAETLSDVAKLGVLVAAKNRFDVADDSIVWKEAFYQCHCSREYIAGVLSSLGEAQTREIIAEDGVIKVHCHYCNTDYEFFEADVGEIFPEKR